MVFFCTLAPSPLLESAPNFRTVLGEEGGGRDFLGKPLWLLTPHANSTFWRVCTRPCGACGQHSARFDCKSLKRLAAPAEPDRSLLELVLVLSLQRDVFWFAAEHVPNPRSGDGSRPFLHSSELTRSTHVFAETQVSVVVSDIPNRGCNSASPTRNLCRQLRASLRLERCSVVGIRTQLVAPDLPHFLVRIWTQWKRQLGSCGLHGRRDDQWINSLH